jgi:hypothetical protein
VRPKKGLARLPSISLMAATSIFFEFQLPNATTWFYFSLLLAVALFFKFTRFLSIRNWDVLTLFLIVPGLLLIREAHHRAAALTAAGASAVGNMGSLLGAGPLATSSALALGGPDALTGGGMRPGLLMWFGYLWLLCGSGYFLIRCLIDLGLTRRPAIAPNLNLAGLAWFAGALFVCLVAVAIQHRDESHETVGKPSAAVDKAERGVETAANGVRGLDSRAWVRPTLALLCHLAVVAALIVIGCRHFQDAHGGMAAATFYVLLPYTAIYVGQWHHAWPIALIVWAVVFYRRPVLAGLFLGLAAGTAYFPALLFPVWLSFYWRRGTGRFTGAFATAAVLSLAVTGTLLWLQGDLAATWRSAMNLCDWQPWRGKTNTEGFWLWLDGQGVHWAYRIPVFIAYMTFVITTAFWPAPKNLAHLVALSAAVLIGVQFWYSDQGGVYVLWYLPLLLLLAFRPNLGDRRPPLIRPETDRLARAGRSLSRLAKRLLGLPEPVSRVG